MALWTEGFEGGIGSWNSGADCNLSIVSEDKHSGTQSLKVVGTGTAADAAVWSAPAAPTPNPAAQSGAFPVTPGKYVRPTGWLKGLTNATTAVNIWLQFVDANGAAISTVVSGSLTTMPANTWTRLLGVGTIVPAGAAYCLMAFTLFGGAGAGDVTYIDDMMVSEVQVAVPDGDLVKGTWKDQAGSNAALYAAIDEIPNINTDYIEGTYKTNGDTCTFSLQNISDPADDSDHVVAFFALRVGGTGATTCKAELLQGATVIATFTTPAMTNATIQYSFALTTAQAALITDYNDLRLRFTQNVPGTGSNSAQVRITQAYLTVPALVPVVVGGQVKVRAGGAFAAKKTKVRIGGAFAEKPVKTKIAGSWVSA